MLVEGNDLLVVGGTDNVEGGGKFYVALEK